MAQSKIVIDSEFASLIPPLAPDEYAGLENSILADGCRDALVTWKGILIDGHHRYKICQQHGKPFRTVELRFLDTRESVMEWMLKTQMGRRNLTDVERARLALKHKEVITARAKAKQAAGGGAAPQKSAEPALETRKAVAALAGVSHDTISKVAKIDARAVGPIVQSMETGDISINVAAKLADLPADQQQKIAAGGKKAMKQAAKALTRKPKKLSNQAEGAPVDASPYHETRQMLEKAHTELHEISQSKDDGGMLDAAIAENEQLRAIIRELESCNARLKEEIAKYIDESSAYKAEIERLRCELNVQPETSEQSAI